MASKTRASLTPEQQQAERDALLDQVARAATPSDAYAALDGLAADEQAKAKQDEGYALWMARARGALVWTAYRGVKQDRGEQAGAPRDVTFATVRDTLSIPARPKQGEQGTPWHGMAYQTAEQAYALHQYCPEDGVIEQAWRKFVKVADADQAKYLGNRPSSLIGLSTFARRAVKGEDGIDMPTSGTMAARRDLLVDQVLTAADGKVAERGVAEREVQDAQRILRDSVERAAGVPIAKGVPGLHCSIVSMWTDKQIQDVIDALRLVKGWVRPPKGEQAEQAPAQAEQAEQVANLAKQAEQGEQAPAQAPRSILAMLTPEQVAALTPEQVAALA